MMLSSKPLDALASGRFMNKPESNRFSLTANALQTLIIQGEATHFDTPCVIIRVAPVSQLIADITHLNILMP
jgi:hypothetical protein